MSVSAPRLGDLPLKPLPLCFRDWRRTWPAQSSPQSPPGMPDAWECSPRFSCTRCCQTCVSQKGSCEQKVLRNHQSMQKHKQDDGCLGHLGCSRYKVNGAVLNENEKSCGKERKTKKTRGKKSDNHSQIPTSCENQASGVKATTKKAASSQHSW